MNPLYGKDVKYKEYPKVGIYGFYIFNYKIVDFFKDFGILHGSKINIKVPKEILTNDNLIKRFLRGLFDTDGSLYFERNKGNNRNNQPRIKLGMVSKKLIKEVKFLLESQGLNPMLKKPYKGKKDKNYVHSVLIYRKSDVKNYIRIIGFKNSKHYTKWQIYKKLGYCPPRTTLKKRNQILYNENL